MDAWPSTLYGIDVTKHDLGKADPCDDPVSAILHTTEGDSIEGALSVFDAEPAIASQWVVGKWKSGRVGIVQLRRMGHRGGSLRGDLKNDPHGFQIEIVGHSKEGLWSPSDEVEDAVAAVLAYGHRWFGYKLAKPRPEKDWPDSCSDMPLPWAVTTNSRREWAGKNGRWPSIKAVWQHCWIPDNTHWDCGAMRQSTIVDKAKALLAPAPPPEPERGLYPWEAAMNPDQSDAFTNGLQDAQSLNAYGTNKNPDGTYVVWYNAGWNFGKASIAGAAAEAHPGK